MPAHVEPVRDARIDVRDRDGLEALEVALRAGADEVEVVYAFLERPDAVVSTVFARAAMPRF